MVYLLAFVYIFTARRLYKSFGAVTHRPNYKHAKDANILCYVRKL
jgi:hypothetical protein